MLENSIKKIIFSYFFIQAHEFNGINSDQYHDYQTRNNCSNRFLTSSSLRPSSKYSTITWLHSLSRKFSPFSNPSALRAITLSRTALIPCIPSTKSSSKTFRMGQGEVTLQTRQLRKQVTNRLRKSPELSSIRTSNWGQSSLSACRILCSSLKKRGEPSWQSSLKALRCRKWQSSCEYLGGSKRGKATTTPKQTYSRPLQYRTCGSSRAQRMSESQTHCIISFQCCHTRSASRLRPRCYPIARTTLCSLTTFCFKLLSSPYVSSYDRMVNICCLFCCSAFSLARNYCSTPSLQFAIDHNRYRACKSLLFRVKTAPLSLTLNRLIPSPFYQRSPPATSRCLLATSSSHYSAEKSPRVSLRSSTMKVSSSTTIPTVMSSSIEGRGGLSLRERKTSSLSGGEEGYGCSSSNYAEWQPLFLSDILIFQIQSIMTPPNHPSLLTLHSLITFSIQSAYLYFLYLFWVVGKFCDFSVLLCGVW